MLRILGQYMPPKLSKYGISFGLPILLNFSINIDNMEMYWNKRRNKRNWPAMNFKKTVQNSTLRCVIRPLKCYTLTIYHDLVVKLFLILKINKPSFVYIFGCIHQASLKIYIQWKINVYSIYALSTSWKKRLSHNCSL